MRSHLATPRSLRSIAARARLAQRAFDALTAAVAEKGTGGDWPPETLAGVRSFLESVEAYAEEGAELMAGRNRNAVAEWTRAGPRLRVGAVVVEDPVRCQDGR